MADTVTTQTIADTTGIKFVTKMTNFSDGTGESLVKKIDAVYKKKNGLNEIFKFLSGFK